MERRYVSRGVAVYVRAAPVAEGLLERDEHGHVPTERGQAAYPAMEALLRRGGEHPAAEPSDCPECARPPRGVPAVAR